ncbi:MAG: hypothetical protein KKF68_03110 [Nanoarchaeota archaeon]|nr:hypothetical protein [Nanoarchaeota archaeon]
MNKKGSGIAINKLVTIIIILFLIVVVVSSLIYNFNPLSYLRNLPSYSIPEDEEVDLSDLTEEQIKSICPYKIGEIKRVGSNWGFGKYFIYLGEVNTQLYLDMGDGEIIHVDAGKVGAIADDTLIFDDFFMSQKYLEYENMLGIDDLKVIDNSYKIPGNFLCKTQKAGDEIIGEKKCFVEEVKSDFSSGDVFSAEELEIKRFLFVPRTESGGKLENLLEKNSIEITEKSSFAFDFEIDSPLEFCYVLKSDIGGIISLGYIGEGESMKQTVFNWNPSKEKFIELIIWNSEENKKISKKIEVNINFPLEKYLDGKVILNNDFKREILKAKKGEIFYIFDLKYDWNVGGFFDGRISFIGDTYKIIKLEDKLEIFVKHKISEKEEEWHALDCDKSLPFWWALKLEKIKGESLKENLASHCEWE